jgi:serine/threonine protein kinase
MSFRPQDNRIGDRLARWEELREQGRTISAESLCGDAPELVAEVARQIQALIAMDRIVDPDATPAYAGTGEAGNGVRSSATSRVRYHDLRFHAAGGLGEVFTASGDDLNRRVAIKFIKPSRAGDPNSRGRFLFEAEVTARLEHPGVVPVYGLGTDEHDCPCYAMRLIGGTTLQDAIDAFYAAAGPGRDRDEGGRALRELLRRFVSVCNTVGYAHSRGVLHRDLKPKNIMLGPFEETLVVDWGLAKPFVRDAGVDPAADALTRDAATIDATCTADVMGTPGYLSPEQARGEPVSPAGDVYSLGALLYAILTGRPPLGGSSVNEALERTRRNDFPAARTINPAVPRALDAICSKAMATRPDDRYAGAVELAADVNRWLADEPTGAYREPIRERARRWMRRHRTLTTASAAAMLVAMMGLSVLLVVQAHANAELRTAKQATDRALAESQESRKQTDAVNSFMVEVLRSPDPSADGRAIRVVDLLNRATAKLDKEFTGSAATKGMLLAALSETYIGLGLRDHALALLGKARLMRQAALGPDHADTIATCSDLVRLLVLLGRPAEAVELGEATLKRCESRLGADHPTTLATRSHLGAAYRDTGRLSEAVALHEGTLRLREAKLGADHHDTLESRNGLAMTYFAAGRLTKAVELFEETVRLCESKLGSDHPDTLSSRSNLATVYMDVGRLSAAIALQEQLLKVNESKLGPGHPQTITARNNLACSYYTAGQWPDAIPLFEEVLKQRKLNQGPTHPETLLARNNLGVA